MTVDHEFKGSAISLCCEICGEGHSYHKNNYCPQCSRFREKLNREKMAMLLCAMMCSPLGTPSPEEHWGPVKDSVREIWRSHAATLIAYLTE